MQNLNVRLYQGAAVAGGLLMSAGAFAEEADPTVTALAKVAQAGVWGAAIGGAALGVFAAIAAFKWVRKAL